MAIKFKGIALNDGQKILVSRYEKDKDQYTSSIDSIDPRAIVITYPLLNQETMDLKRGENVYVTIPVGSFILEFRTRVKGYRTDNVLLVELDHPADYKRIQRRSTVRLKTLLDIELAPEPENPAEELKYIKATGLDISAGGMEAMSPAFFEKESTVLVRFDLDVDKKNVHRIEVTARVRRVVPAPVNKYKIGLEFLDLSRSDTDRIFQYIFKKSAEKNRWSR